MHAGKTLKYSLVTLVSVIGLLLALMVEGAYFLVGPNMARAMELVSKAYLEADVKAVNADVTLWSTWPHLSVNIDSITVVTHNFGSLPDSVRKRLPENADSVASAHKLSFSMDLASLLGKKVKVHHVAVDGGRLNFVAVNDSVYNYNIFHASKPKAIRVPEFAIDTFRFTHSRGISYFSLATNTTASVRLTEASLTNKGDFSNTYNLRLGGYFDARPAGVNLLNDFPFLFDGRIALRFNPFRIHMENYGINLGNIHTDVNMNMNLGADAGVLHFNSHVKSFSILQLLQYLPAELMPQLREIKSDMHVEASVSMDGPYKFSSSVLPSFTLHINVPDSYLSYRLSGGQQLELHDVSLHGRLHFNGADPAASVLYIPDMTMRGAGITANISARADNLFSSQPDVVLNVGADANALEMARYFGIADLCSVSGDAHLDATLSCSYLGGDNPAIINPLAKGRVTINGAKGHITPDSIDLAARRLTVDFQSHASSVSLQALTAGQITVGVAADGMQLSAPGGKFTAESFHLATSAQSRSLSLGNLPTHTFPLTVTLGADGVTETFGGVPLRVDGLEGLARIGNVNPSAPQNAPLTADLSIRRARADIDSLMLTGSDFSLKVGGHWPENKAVADSTLRGYGRFMRNTALKCDATIGSILMTTPAYPNPVTATGLKASMAGDVVSLSGLQIKSQSNILDVNGFIAGLGRKVTDSNPMHAALDLRIDTLNLNQVARTYKSGSSARTFASTTPADSLSDTRPLLIPKNIDLRLNASVKDLYYTNLHLFDLGTDIHVADGIADISHIGVGASFGTAELAVKYMAADSQHLGMQLTADIDSINIPRFFAAFPKVEAMMPQLTNLFGTVSASATGGMQLFPDMVINLPSIDARVNISGRDLRVHQSKFIRHITRMMLIHSSGDLNIRNMNVFAAVRDNRLELYPFIFEMNRYKVMMLGANDFAGDLYYHVEVLHSPIPFRFGINIEGTFDKYKIRFGRSRYDEYRAMHLDDLIENKRVNLITELKYYLDKMISSAASTPTR